MGSRRRVNGVHGDEHWVRLLLAVSCLYIALLLRFYLVRYDVPDYFLYHRFGREGLPAKDGFSSLFVLLATYDTRYPLVYHLVPLFCLGTALFALNFAFRPLPWVERTLLLGFSVSSGIWYYFAGKVFYEFPFIALCLSLSVAAVKAGEKRTGRGWPALALCLMGFGLSIKPFALFGVLGLLLLVAVDPRTRNLYGTRYRADWLVGTVCFAIGYLCGNYNLLFRFTETVQGLRGYPAHSNLRTHLFDDAKLVWDHVNMASFDSGALNVVSASIILFVLPLLLRNRFYLWVNLVIATGYAVFIEKFSPGYTWHAFSFCLFIIFALAFMLAEGASLRGTRLLVFRGFVGVALVLQAYGNFAVYLPKQVAWFDAARSAGEMLERESAHINREILALADQLDGTFAINLTYKFTKPVRDDPKGQSPLQVGDPQGWGSIIVHPRYKAAVGHEYVIFVEPTVLRQVPSYIDERSDVRSTEAPDYRLGHYAVR